MHTHTHTHTGTSEGKQRAGITGDVEFVSLDKDALVLRLTGNFPKP
jgi:hypothetical protein